MQFTGNTRLVSLSLILSTMLFLLAACNGFNQPGTSGPVWLGDPIITSGLDQNGKPIDNRHTFDTETHDVYCYLSIRGPDNVVLGVKWYKEDTLIADGTITFDADQDGAALLHGNKGPLSYGSYRCEIYATSEPLRVVKFYIK